MGCVPSRSARERLETSTIDVILQDDDVSPVFVSSNQKLITLVRQAAPHLHAFPITKITGKPMSPGANCTMSSTERLDSRGVVVARMLSGHELTSWGRAFV